MDRLLKHLNTGYQYVRYTFDSVERVLMLVAKAALFVMMLAITATTAGRYLLDFPIPGTFELVEVYLMVALVFLSAPWIQHVGANVSVTAFSQNFSPRVNRLCLFVGLSATIVFLAIINRGIAGVVWSRYSTMATTTGALNWPTFVSWTMAFVGLAMLKVRLGLQLVELAIGSPEEVQPTGIEEMSDEISDSVE